MLTRKHMAVTWTQHVVQTDQRSYVVLEASTTYKGKRYVVCGNAARNTESKLRSVLHAEVVEDIRPHVRTPAH